MNEQEMRVADVPWFDTRDELHAYIDDIVEQDHDYGTSVYAMSMAAVATYQYVAKKLGTTGFQASVADLDIIKRTRGIKGPFMIIDGENMLYPQYNILEKVRKFLDESKPWAREEAAKLLKKNEDHVHPDVEARWRELIDER